ncbi:GntR family transcriptional regulator [Streptomyces albiflavescens]|uniref:GntR family transcriptional regulator n=1 Tax=Streptomyces albiflavescens TaxID=1623582 RepID=A0A918D1B0_9ACTN|nr:PLP-dependent aminotransferase family protein [Streptomyces albiflavescens]GGN56433.1 GntR family transcriptional regulator [Streptomyces albiflavescens]
MPENWSSSRLDLHLDLDTEGGRRARLETALREAIRAGRLTAGTPLPSTRGLAQEMGLSRGTVTAAYDQLAEQGYLLTRPGAATRVADVPPQLPPETAPDTGTRPPAHDLRPGRPDVSAFPTRAWLAATRRVLDRARPEVFGPGDPQGRIELRAALADHLGRTRGVLTTPDRIVITSGYYQTVQLLCRVLTAGGREVAALEDPGHDFYRDTVRRAGLTTYPLPVDAHGADAEFLTARTDAVFLTPSHHYPTGVPLHPGRRQAVCAWARSTGGLIVEDDYDGEFRYDRRPVGALQSLAPDHVAYCGTASKTLGPALRLAWAVLPPDLVAPVVRAKETDDLYTETLGQLVLAEFIATHAYDRHVRAARLRYRRRRELLIARLSAVPGLTAHGVPAGLHTLVTLPPEGPVEAGFLSACADRGVALRGLTELHHSLDGDRPEGLLIGFAAPSERAYPAALDALFAVLEESVTCGKPSG